MFTKLRPGTIVFGLLAFVLLAWPAVVASAAAGDDNGEPSILDDSDQAVPANQLQPYRHHGRTSHPLMGMRSITWTEVLPQSFRRAMAKQFGRYSFDNEVEESVLFIK